MHEVDMRDIYLVIDGLELTATDAQQLATTAAGCLEGDLMVVAWYDGQRGEEHPEVKECQHKPGWLAYAEGHGGSIRVDINHGEFIYIFAAAAAVE